MVAELGGSESEGQLTLSIFMVGLAVGQLAFGPLSDQFGRVRVVRIGTALFMFTSVLCALAQSMDQMWALRGLQGARCSKRSSHSSRNSEGPLRGATAPLK